MEFKVPVLVTSSFPFALVHPHLVILHLALQNIITAINMLFDPLFLVVHNQSNIILSASNYKEILAKTG